MTKAHRVPKLIFTLKMSSVLLTFLSCFAAYWLKCVILERWIWRPLWYKAPLVVVLSFKHILLKTQEESADFFFSGHLSQFSFSTQYKTLVGEVLNWSGEFVFFFNRICLLNLTMTQHPAALRHWNSWNNGSMAFHPLSRAYATSLSELKTWFTLSLAEWVKTARVHF